MTAATRQRLSQLGALAVVIALVLAIAISVFGGRATPTLAPGHPVPHAAAVSALFAGVPEHGSALGANDAPLTLVEFADLQCPYCAAFARDALPTLIRREVRPGRLRIVFVPLSLLGADSRRGAALAIAAAAQDRLWPLVDLFYANQRDEGSGYVDGPFLAALAGATPGLDAARALSDRSTPAVSAALASAAALASRLDVRATPSFALSRTGAALVSFSPADLQAGAFTGPIDARLAQSAPP